MDIPMNSRKWQRELGSRREVRLQLLHTTDQHGTAVPISKKVKTGDEVVRVQKGGIAYLSRMALDYRDKNQRTTLMVDTGDAESGQVVTDIDGGRSMAKLMNEVGYNAVTPGNHAFDFGPDTFRERLALTEHKVVATNLKNEDGSAVENTVPHEMFELEGLKVGMVGLLTDKIAALVTEENREGFVVDNVGDALAEELPKLKEKGADLVVVLSHQDDELDEALAQRFPDEGMIILGGHSHVTMPEAKEVSGNFVYKSGSLGTALGQILVDFDTESNKVVDITARAVSVDPESMEPDAEVAEMVARYKAISDEKMGEVVLVSDRTFTRDARQDSDLGNLMTDAMRNYFDADVAFCNTDGLRADLEAGPVTKGHVHSVRPFSGDESVPGRMKGKDILGALEHSVTQRDTDGKSPFLQVSGVTFEYDKEGVKNLKVGGNPIDLDAEYKVVLNNYLVAGKLGYESFLNGEFENAGIGSTPMLSRYLQSTDLSTVDPTGTRIKDLTGLPATEG